MKKTYIAPEMSMATINAEELICLSMQDGKADGSTVLGNKRANPEDIKQPEYGNLW